MDPKEEIKKCKEVLESNKMEVSESPLLHMISTHYITPKNIVQIVILEVEKKLNCILKWTLKEGKKSFVIKDFNTDILKTTLKEMDEIIKKVNEEKKDNEND